MHFYISLFFILLWMDSCNGIFYQVFPSLEQLNSFMLFFRDIGIVFIAFATLKRTSLKYLFIFISVIFVALISYMFESGITLVQFLNGARDFIPMFFSLIFVNNMLQSNQRTFFYRKMNYFILLFLAIQVPVCILQFFMFGMGDEVGGTIHLGSGNLSILIYICTFYFLTQSLDDRKPLQSLLKNKYIFLLWIPSLINETKITFLLIIMFFLMCLKYNLHTIIKNIPLAFLGIFLLIIFLQVYEKYEYQGRSIFQVMQGSYLVEYNLDKVYEYIDKHGDKLNIEHTDSRTVRLVLGIWELKKDNISLLFGKSFGHFKGSSIGLTKFARENEYVTGKGSKPFILIVAMQVGIIGTLLVFLAIFIGLSKQNELLLSLKRNKNRMRCFLLIIFLGTSYYNQAFLALYFSAIFFYIGAVSTLPDSISEQLKLQQFFLKKIKSFSKKNIYSPRANNMQKVISIGG